MIDVQNVVKVSDIELVQCPICHTLPPDNVAEAINHYLKHGYKLLHVGQETSRDGNSLWQSSVAFLGK